jgi:hypothetical protein
MFWNYNNSKVIGGRSGYAHDVLHGELRSTAIPNLYAFKLVADIKTKGGYFCNTGKLVEHLGGVTRRNIGFRTRHETRRHPRACEGCAVFADNPMQWHRR